jgi:hypothetical protein
MENLENQKKLFEEFKRKMDILLKEYHRIADKTNMFCDACIYFSEKKGSKEVLDFIKKNKLKSHPEAREHLQYWIEETQKVCVKIDQLKSKYNISELLSFIGK